MCSFRRSLLGHRLINIPRRSYQSRERILSKPNAEDPTKAPTESCLSALHLLSKGFPIGPEYGIGILIYPLYTIYQVGARKADPTRIQGAQNKRAHRKNPFILSAFVERFRSAAPSVGLSPEAGMSAMVQRRYSGSM